MKLLAASQVEHVITPDVFKVIRHPGKDTQIKSANTKNDPIGH